MSLGKWVMYGGIGVGVYLVFTRFETLDIFSGLFALIVIGVCLWFGYNIYRVNADG
jgi:hypothetical protein